MLGIDQRAQTTILSPWGCKGCRVPRRQDQAERTASFRGFGSFLRLDMASEDKIVWSILRPMQSIEVPWLKIMNW